MSKVQQDWVDQLPNLDGLFTHDVSASALIRPFSLLSLPFFRRKTSSTSTDALTTLRSASGRAESEGTADFDMAVKALTALQSFIAQSKTDIRTLYHSESSVELLHEAYLRGFYTAARATCGRKWHDDMGQAARECLSGYTRLDTKVGEAVREKWRPHLVGAIFPITSEESYLLSPIFQRPRQLAEEIQRHHIQRSGGKKALRDTAPAQIDPVRDNGEEAEHLIDLLDLFQRHTEEYKSLPGPTVTGNPAKLSKAKIKAMEDEGVHRPLRIALESRITKCELATALASADIFNMKARARVTSRSPTPDLLSDAGSSVDGEALDVKPKIRERVTQSPASVTSEDEEAETPSREVGVLWDECAEEILYECLNHCCRLLAERHSVVLTSPPQRSDWLDTNSGLQAPKSPIKRATEDSDEDDESDTETDTDSDDDQASSQIRATPLRAIVRLQDRYEELRLAVWLSLPPDSRGKMSAYMRGAPVQAQMLKIHGPNMGDAKFKEKINGRIGEAWDKFGMALLKKFDSRELQRHGLDPEKLDKWEELLSVKGAKRAKKGRKTV